MNIRVLLLATTLCCAATVSFASEMKPGKWEYTMTTVVPGLPFSLPDFTRLVCLTAEDAAYGVARTENGKKGDCRFENLKRSGPATHYDMVCNQQASGRFEFTSTADSIEGKGVIRAGETRITQRWRGRRLGDC